jgi:hypothetical protein
MIAVEAVGKHPSAALPSSLVTAAYFYVRLIPRDFGSLAYGHFPSASQRPVFRQSRRVAVNVVNSSFYS